MKLTSTYCAKTLLFWTYFQPIHEECHLFHEMRTNLLKHFELVPCGSFRRTRVLTVQLLGCNCSWFWLEFYHWSNVSGNPNLQLHIEIKWICILLGFLKSGFIPHLPYQTHCPPVEALALKRNIVNLFLDSQGLTKPHLRGKQERRKRKNPLGPIVPPITPEENSVYMAHTNFTNLRGNTYQSLLPQEHPVLSYSET